MFYALSKTLDLLLTPLFWALGFGVLSVWLLRQGRTKQASRTALLALLCVYLPASGLVSHHVFLYTERFDAPRVQEGKLYDAAILLGGFAHPGPGGATELSEGGDRLLRTWELLRRGRAKRVLIVAGSQTAPVEADLAARVLTEAGIDRARISLGRTSLNTRENALEAKQLVTRERLQSLVLITSAFHAQRAYECFRAVGLTPDVLATDHQAPALPNLFAALAPRAFQLAQTELALRELTGRVVYRWRGYSKP